MEFVYYFFHYYWPVFFMSCSSLFLVMFFLIHNFTTPLLKPLRFFLYPANAVMMISITMAFVIQSRTVGNRQSTALLCDGPCKYIGPNFCLHCYHLWRAFGITACVINLHTMYYRTMCLVHLDSKKAHRWTLLYSVHYIFPFSSQVIFYDKTEIFTLAFLHILMLTAPSNHAAVHNETLILHPEYNYTPYLDFGGFDPTEVVYQARNWMFTIATFYSPIIGSYWKHQAMKMLKVHMSPQTSPASRVMLRTLMKGLNFQILLPMISYVPQQLASLYKQVSGQEFPYSQYAGTFLGTLPCLLDPMVQIYFITPYQNAVRRFLECKTLPRGSPSYSWASRVVTS